jgi:hypothetical protein
MDVKVVVSGTWLRSIMLRGVMWCDVVLWVWCGLNVG